MAENAEIERIAIDLTLGIQADMFIEFALGFSRINRLAAAKAIGTIEEAIVRDLRERATDLAARGLSAEGIAQVAGYLDDTIKEARRKMAEVETALRPASDAIVPRVFKQLKDRVAKLYFRQEVILPRKISATSADVRSGGSTTRFF